MSRRVRRVVKEGSKKTFNFISPLEYSIAGFGEKGQDLRVYNLHVSVAQLHSSFKVFEDLNNVQDWPISSLIQRELDHKRASQICDDYLMAGGNTKYFPPLIAVLIPTDEEYRPKDSFGPPDPESLARFEASIFMTDNKYQDQEFKSPEQPFQGFNLVALDDYQGDVSWDAKNLSAVVIDGQHRYKALQKAVERNKKFDDWFLSVTLIDLQPVCAETGKTPTEVARDLFVTINHTLVEVDETRLVLMDDRDLLATCTQALVDDSDDTCLPVCPPELIDWECDGGKHNLSNSITGVLVLRQVVLHSIFDGRNLSSVDDRSNPKVVRRWMDQVNNRLDVDEVIAHQLDDSETLKYRFDSAIKAADADYDGEEGYFLFSYSVDVSKILKSRFKELYLPSFREVYRRLRPYEDLQNLARSSGIFEAAGDTNRYYRAFKGKRDELLKEKPDLKGVVVNYESDFDSLTKDRVFNTVMGQKAVFESLVSKRLAFVEDFDGDEYLEVTKDFVDDFNTVIDALSPGGAEDEQVFCVNYTIPKKRRLSDGLSLVTDFWRGIILKNNGDIDYAKAGVQLLSSVFNDMISAKSSDENFYFSQKDKLVRRHAIILNRMGLDDSKETEEIDELASKIVDYKEAHLASLLANV